MNARLELVVSAPRSSDGRFGYGSSEVCLPERQATTQLPSPQCSPSDPKPAPHGPSRASGDGYTHLHY